MTDMNRPEIRAPRGQTLSCKGWPQEAALRMLMNNLDPEVAEDWKNLVVYGGCGKAARNWQAFDNLVRSLRSLEEDETLLVQSGKPVGIFRTHRDAPRVLLANSNLVPAWANWANFRQLEERGLIMFGQMTAGSWIYIGTQGILQGTYETFAECGRQHFGGTLAGRLVLTAGLGGMGGAQPLSITMAGGVALCVEADGQRIEKRLATRYLDWKAPDLETAVKVALEKKAARQAYSIGLEMNAGVAHPLLLERGLVPDVVTDQTSAHDLLKGYIPHQVPLAEAYAMRTSDPERYQKLASETVAIHLRAMLEFKRRGSVVFDYGNNIRGEGQKAGVEDAFAFPGFVPAYVRPLFCEGKGPFRWAALSGEPADIARTDELVLELFPDDRHLAQWIGMARERVKFQGLPARICWLGLGQRAQLGLAMNAAVGRGEIRAPIVIGRDHLDCGSVASPPRETEAMADGSDAIADWPLLNALLNTASGATWVSLHHGGGVGIGNAIHAGQVSVADGTPEAARRLERVLTNDPGSGVMRHADAGYPRAVEVAREKGVKLPSLGVNVAW